METPEVGHKKLGMRMPVLPDSYFFSLIIFVCISAFGLLRLNTALGVPYLAVALSIGAWYLIEPFYFADEFQLLDPRYVQSAFDSVALFFLAFAIVTPGLVNKLAPRSSALPLSEAFISPEHVLTVVAAAWLALLTYGVVRMQGDILGALFPLGPRWSGDMWGRAAGAAAGSEGFIVSTASYLYTVMLAAFGLLLFLMRRTSYRILAILLILVSWPWAFLQGSRSLTLAVVLPGIMSYLLFSRSSGLVKLLKIVPVLLALEFVLRVIIAYRDVGFQNIELSGVESTRHLGLNMASELVYCVGFIDQRVLQLSYGGGYLQEVVNFIPRAIWSSKPLLGQDYAIARGFGSGFGAATNDIGLVATVSEGVIGQGVLNFGPIFGAVAAAILMGLWVAFLSRLRAQGTPLRLGLFLVGLGLTFNLGRGISLLVLWPIIFGYLGVRALERSQRRGIRVTQQPAQASPRYPLPAVASGRSSPPDKRRLKDS
jgi:hypothetical protein